MKIICIVLMTLGTFIIAPAQEESTVPAEIQDALYTKFANAEDVEWTEDNAVYIADFYIQGDYYLATFDAEGNWIQTEISINEEDLPAAGLKNIKTKYPDGSIYGVYRIEKNDGSVSYKLEVGSENYDYELLVNVSGAIIKTIDQMNME